MIRVMRMLKIGLLVAMTIALAGCATRLGRNFDEAKADQIKRGESTRDDLRAALGPPHAVSKGDGKETWTYAYYEGGSVWETVQLWFGSFKEPGAQKRLTVTFVGDKVNDFRFRREIPVQ